MVLDYENTVAELRAAAERNSNSLRTRDACKAGADAIDELLAKVLLWHPVSDPPKYADYYFVYDGKRIYDCYYFPNVGFASPTLVTHWTSIPGPQKVVE